MSKHHLPKSILSAGWMSHPLMLLVVTGILIGTKFPLGKIASTAGISPMMWAFTISAGAAIFLLPILHQRRSLVLPQGRLWRYIAISGLISFVTPNLLLYTVIPHLGAGYTGLMFALSPFFTFSLAAVFQLEKPAGMKLIGIFLGIVGAGLVSLTRGHSGETWVWTWALLALIIPLALACGNIYRTMDWPEGTPPEVLAFWSNSFAVLIYLAIFLIQGRGFEPSQLLGAPLTTLVQIMIAGVTFPIFFLLQKRGGPVLLSHIGYVAAAVGLIASTLFLGERYSAVTWLGAAVILLGMVFTFLAQWDTSPKNLQKPGRHWLKSTKALALLGKS